MKIDIRILLLTIVVIINFRELNSSKDYGQSSRPNWYSDLLAERRREREEQERQRLAEEEAERLRNPPTSRPQPTPRRRRRNEQAPPPVVTPHEPIVLNWDHHQRIRVPLSSIGGVITPTDCVVIGEHNFIPTVKYRAENNNYAIRALIHGNIKCVVYVDEHGKVLGAKLPPGPNEVIRKGVPGFLNPTETFSFLTYRNQDYGVMEMTIGDERTVLSIELLPNNRVPTTQQEMAELKVKRFPVQCCGIGFVAWKRKNGKAVGAHLI